MSGLCSIAPRDEVSGFVDVLSCSMAQAQSVGNLIRRAQHRECASALAALNGWSKEGSVQLREGLCIRTEKPWLGMGRTRSPSGLVAPGLGFLGGKMPLQCLRHMAVVAMAIARSDPEVEVPEHVQALLGPGDSHIDQVGIAAGKAGDDSGF